jgi:hypothetical protein
MSLTKQQAKDSLEGMVHSTNLNSVQNLDDLFRRVGSKMSAELDMQETRRIVNFTTAIHDDVFDYTLPSDFKKAIDIRPQVNRDIWDSFSQRGAKEFDKYKDRIDDTFQVKHDDGSKSIRISKNVSPAPTTVNQFDSLTDNGTWAVFDDGSNVTRDTQFFISGGASLNFDLDGSGTNGGIQASDMTSVDLTTHDEKSTHFLRVYFPDASIITSVALLWGNDLTANYWERTETTQWDSTAFRNGWNILGFNWNGATETGTVDPSAIDSGRINIVYDGTADTDIRVDQWTSSIGEIYEIEYYSKFMFRTSGGTWQATTTEDTDIINVDNDAENIFLHECVVAIAQQLQGEDSGFDITFNTSELYGSGNKKGLYQIYKENHTQESLPQQTTYYRTNRFRKRLGTAHRGTNF